MFSKSPAIDVHAFKKSVIAREILLLSVCSKERFEHNIWFGQLKNCCLTDMPIGATLIWHYP